MAKDVKVSWSYSETIAPYKNGDLHFYQSLPGSKTDSMKGGPPIGGPDFNPIILMGGTALLSSSVLATAIKAYVTLKRRKIVISAGDKKLEYEGPDLEYDQKSIEAMIDKLLDGVHTTSLDIYAGSE